MTYESTIRRRPASVAEASNIVDSAALATVSDDPITPYTACRHDPPLSGNDQVYFCEFDCELNEASAESDASVGRVDHKAAKLGLSL